MSPAKHLVYILNTWVWQIVTINNIIDLLMASVPSTCTFPFQPIYVCTFVLCTCTHDNKVHYIPVPDGQTLPRESSLLIYS